VSEIKSIHTSGIASHVIVVMNDNTMWSWGSNEAGQLGPQASAYSIVMTPMQVTGLPGSNAFGSAALGWKQSFAHGGGVYAYAWGYNISGMLGDGTNTLRTTPVQVVDVGGFSSMAGGALFTVAVRPDGSLWQWGSALNHSTTPYRPQNIGSGFSAVAAGMSHAIALAADGSVWTWGTSNTDGQLGRTVQATASGNDAGTPVQVMTGVAKVWAGANSGYALKTDGTLWAWGANGYGQLGDGSTVSRATPAQVPGSFTRVSPGGEHVAALKADGSLWTWGRNNWGQLANGGTQNVLAPQQVSTGWTMVAAGGGFTLVANAAGEIWGAGHNYYGELGNGQQVATPTSTLTRSLF
jgi:alpha-tubulin suppressor-like RCC1 family protein